MTEINPLYWTIDTQFITRVAFYLLDGKASGYIFDAAKWWQAADLYHKFII